MVDTIRIESIERLKTIGLKKIADETHISYTRLEDIVLQRYEKLDRTSIFGILKILERDYGIDMNDWRAQYDKHMRCDDECEEDADEETEDVMEEPKNLMAVKILLAVILFVCVIAVFYFGTKSSDNSVVAVVKDTQKEIVVESEKAQEQPLEIKNTEEKTEPLEVVETKEANVIEAQAATALAQNTAPVIETPKEVIIESPKEQPREKTTENGIKNISLSPVSRVWVGVIYTDTYEKSDFFVERRFDFNTSRSFIAVCGHGDINLSVDSNTTYVNSKNPVRFAFDGKEDFHFINTSEFRRLNRGMDW